MNARTHDVAGDYESNGAVTFRKIMFLLAIAAAIVAGVVTYINRPNTITIDDKHWTCIDSEPVGIVAECTNLKKKTFTLRTQ